MSQKKAMHLLAHFRYRNVSRLARRLIEHRWFRLGIASCLISTFFLASSFPVGGQAQAFSEVDFKASDLVTEEILLTTQKTSRLPVAGHLSQGFTHYHPGIDIENPFDSSINPMLSGIVLETGFNHGGYGNYILIDHQNGFASLYAHLNDVFVQKDTSVLQDTIIGTVGLTGYTTGSHVHIEVYENGRAINPLSVLPADLLPSNLANQKAAIGGLAVHPSRTLSTPISQQAPLTARPEQSSKTESKETEEKKPTLGIWLPSELRETNLQEGTTESKAIRQLPKPLTF